MILAALFAANCLLPPGPYQPPRMDAVDLQFGSPTDVQDFCNQYHVRSENGCEIGYGGHLRVQLATGSSSEESCALQHALGHIADYERTGNPNQRHVGWEYQE